MRISEFNPTPVYLRLPLQFVMIAWAFGTLKLLKKSWAPEIKNYHHSTLITDKNYGLAKNILHRDVKSRTC